MKRLFAFLLAIIIMLSFTSCKETVKKRKKHISKPNTSEFDKETTEKPLTTKNGHITLTPSKIWKMGDAQYDDAITIYNDNISPFTWVSFIDDQLKTVDELMLELHNEYEGYEFRPEAIGNNTYHILETDDTAYLVAECSTGKAIKIEVCNCTLDDANDLLETVIIK